jgi:hypothetical protein
MWKSLLLIAVLCSAAAMPQGTTAGGRGKKNPKFSKTALKEYDRRERLILEELATLKGDEWSGEYSYGNNLSRNQRLLIAPKSGFVFTSFTHRGIYDRNYGEIERTDNSFKLTFKFPNYRGIGEWMGEELLLVRWGELHYLIASDGVVDFCNAINAGREPPEKITTANGEAQASRLLSGFLLRVGDENKTVSGLPKIPDQFLEYLLDNPIETTIASVGESKTEKSADSQLINRSTRMTLAAGHGQGVRKGMEFFIHNPAADDDRATILEVNKDTSDAVVDQSFFSYSVPPIPAVGWRLSTCFVSKCGKGREK